MSTMEESSTKSIILREAVAWSSPFFNGLNGAGPSGLGEETSVRRAHDRLISFQSYIFSTYNSITSLDSYSIVTTLTHPFYSYGRHCSLLPSTTFRPCWESLITTLHTLPKQPANSHLPLSQERPPPAIPTTALPSRTLLALQPSDHSTCLLDLRPSSPCLLELGFLEARETKPKPTPSLSQGRARDLPPRQSYDYIHCQYTPSLIQPPAVKYLVSSAVLIGFRPFHIPTSTKPKRQSQNSLPPFSLRVRLRQSKKGSHSITFTKATMLIQRMY